MRLLVAFVLAGIIGGCASTPAPTVKWVANPEKGQFTDQLSCTVSVGTKYTRSGVYAYGGHLYPFLAIVDGKLQVGVKSGGQVPVPVGDVQLRIKGHDAWTITTAETPLPDSASGSQQTMATYMKGLEGVPESQRKLAMANYDKVMEIASRASLPVTATTGDKAQAILNQILTGQTLIYRSVVPGTKPGEYALDRSFIEALSIYGVKVEV